MYVLPLKVWWEYIFSNPQVWIGNYIYPLVIFDENKLGISLPYFVLRRCPNRDHLRVPKLSGYVGTIT